MSGQPLTLSTNEYFHPLGPVFSPKSYVLATSFLFLPSTSINNFYFNFIFTFLVWKGKSLNFTLKEGRILFTIAGAGLSVIVTFFSVGLCKIHSMVEVVICSISILILSQSQIIGSFHIYCPSRPILIYFFNSYGKNFIRDKIYLWEFCPHSIV